MNIMIDTYARRLIMDGPLLLTRVVRKAVVSFEAINAQGDASTVQVDCLAPELTPRPLVGILCNDLLVLCRDPSEGKDSTSYVDLWAVLRMQTLPQPASIVHGNGNYAIFKKNSLSNVCLNSKRFVSSITKPSCISMLLHHLLP